MAALSITPDEPIAIIEVDDTERTLTLTGKFRRVSLLNIGSNPVLIRTKTGVFVNTDPSSVTQEDGEAVIPAGQSFPLWTSLTSVQYLAAAGLGSTLVMAADTD